MPIAATPNDERRSSAHAARRQRAQRIARLRRKATATALGTFVLAFGVIAYDGSMGEQNATAESANSAATEPVASSSSDSSDSMSTSSSASSASSDDALTTSQS